MPAFVPVEIPETQEVRMIPIVSEPEVQSPDVIKNSNKLNILENDLDVQFEPISFARPLL